MTEIERVEKRLLRLLTGEHSSLSLDFNDAAATGYQTVAEYLDALPTDWEKSKGPDWVSEEERERAREHNSMWTLRWYPCGQVGFDSVAASSLSAIFAYLDRWGLIHGSDDGESE